MQNGSTAFKSSSHDRLIDSISAEQDTSSYRGLFRLNAAFDKALVFRLEDYGIVLTAALGCIMSVYSGGDLHAHMHMVMTVWCRSCAKYWQAASTFHMLFVVYFMQDEYEVAGHVAMMDGALEPYNSNCH